jgi:hypothetical protein
MMKGEDGTDLYCSITKQEIMGNQLLSVEAMNIEVPVPCKIMMLVGCNDVLNK